MRVAQQGRLLAFGRGRLLVLGYPARPEPIDPATTHATPVPNQYWQKFVTQPRPDDQPPSFVPQRSTKYLAGWVFDIPFAEKKWDPDALRHLPAASKRHFADAEIDAGLRPALRGQKGAFVDERGFHRYRIHNFPAGAFIEICGNLVRLDYRPTQWCANRGSRYDYETPQIVEFCPTSQFYSWSTSSIVSRLADNLRDLRELGPAAWLTKMQRCRRAWWQKEGKVLVGIDRCGNKYWESPRPQRNPLRHRWVEYASWSPTWALTSDIPMEWYRWIRCIDRDPPNRPEHYHMWFEDYWHHAKSFQSWGDWRDRHVEGDPRAFAFDEWRRNQFTPDEAARTYEWDPTSPEGGRRSKDPYWPKSSYAD